MSKDKGGKNIKKSPATGDKKAVSDYQAGKKSTGITLVASKKKS